MNARNLSGCPWVGQNVGERETRMGELIEVYA